MVCVKAGPVDGKAGAAPIGEAVVEQRCAIGGAVVEQQCATRWVACLGVFLGVLPLTARCERRRRRRVEARGGLGVGERMVRSGVGRRNMARRSAPPGAWTGESGAGHVD